MIFTRPAEVRDFSYIDESLRVAFGGADDAVHGEVIELADSQAIVAELDGAPIGLLTYRDGRRGGREIVTLLTTRHGSGAGGALLDRVRDEASRDGIRRLWLITTNDNTSALRFYQRHGFDLIRLDHGAVDRARELKPGIPPDSDGIPIRHELELELWLDQALSSNQ